MTEARSYQRYVKIDVGDIEIRLIEWALRPLASKAHLHREGVW